MFQRLRMYPKFATFSIACYVVAGLWAAVVTKLAGRHDYVFFILLALGIVLFSEIVIAIIIVNTPDGIARFRGIVNRFEGIVSDENGQDVAEYAVMLAVILAIAIGTIHLIGSQASTVFSQIGSKIQ